MKEAARWLDEITDPMNQILDEDSLLMIHAHTELQL